MLFLFQLLQRATKLVGTGGAFHAASDTVEVADNVVYLLPCHQSAYPLQIAVASADEADVLYHVVIVSRHLYHL